MRAVFRNSVYNFSGQIIPLILALVAMPVTERGYGLQRFSLLIVVWTLLGYFSFLDLGFGRATTKFIAEARTRQAHDELPRIIWGSLALNFTVGVFAAAVILFVFPPAAEHLFNIPVALKEEAVLLIRILALSVPAVTIASGLRGALEASERFDLVNAIKIPTNSLLFLLPIAGAIFQWGLVTVVVLIVASRLLTVALNLYFVGRELPAIYARPDFRRHTFLSLIRFGGWVSVNNFVSPIVAYGERFIILSMLPVVWMSYYSTPSEMIARMVVIPASVSLTLFPKFSNAGLHPTEHVAKTLILKPTKFMLLLLTPMTVIVILCSHSILAVWMNPVFAEHSHVVLSVLAIAIFFNALGQIPFSALQGFGRPDLTAKIITIEAVLFLCACWFAVRDFGIEGAAWAKLIALGGETAMLFTFTFSLLKLGWQEVLNRELSRMLIIVCTALPAALMVKAYISSDEVQILVATVLACAVLLTGWRIAISRSEKEEILSLLRRPFAAGTPA